MEPIHSGTTTERIVRTTLILLLMGGFGAAYLRDGFGGYARKNARTVADNLGLPKDTALRVNFDLSVETASRVAQEVVAGDPLEKVTAQLGEPTVVHEGSAYFLGPGVRVAVKLSGDRVAAIEWTEQGLKTEGDQFLQRVIGVVLASFALVLLVQLVRVVTTRATLSEAGLKLRGRPIVPFDAMGGLTAERYRKTGWVELAYTLDGRDASVRLDSYIIKEFRPIVSAICERCGFDNPLVPEADSDAGTIVPPD